LLFAFCLFSTLYALRSKLFALCSLLYADRNMAPSIILINPWIYDFCRLRSLVKASRSTLSGGVPPALGGFNIHLIDCLDIHHPALGRARCLLAVLMERANSSEKKRLDRRPLSMFHRSYSRYGIPKQLFVKALKEVRRPTAILVTSLMTYLVSGRGRSDCLGSRSTSRGLRSSSAAFTGTPLRGARDRDLRRKTGSSRTSSSRQWQKFLKNFLPSHQRRTHPRCLQRGFPSLPWTCSKASIMFRS